MAECPKLAAEIAELEAKRKESDRLRLAAIGAASSLDEAPSGVFRTFSMVDGTKVRVNPMEFQKQVEKTMVAMGEDELRKLVQSNFDKNVVPAGSKGMNINYAEQEFNEEHVNILLEVMGAHRRSSKEGQKLMMPFTSEVAQNQLAAEISLRGGNTEEIARGMARNQSAYEKLPLDMVMSKVMRQDSAQYLADQLDDIAQLMDTIGVSPENKKRVARSAQYAYFFEQLDAMLARKVGQALQARKIDSASFDFSLTNLLENLTYEDVRLDLNKVNENSLAAQILEAIETGDAPALKKVARLKRMNNTKGITLNKREVMTQIQILNNYRKANLFASPATWISRNVVSGSLVNATYMMEDVYEGAYRVGIADGFRAANYAGAQTLQGMSSAFANAFEVLGTGEATLTKVGLIEGVDAGNLVNRKSETIDQLNDSWDRVFGLDGRDNGLSNGVAVMSWLNAGARMFTGELIEKLSGGKSTAGYSPIFTALAAGDEVNRKMAFDWKTSHESYIRATEDWNSAFDIGSPKPKKSEWIAKRANELAEKAIFKGVMTDDELVKVRRSLGMNQFGDMDNEAMRLKIFNDQNGMPDPSNEIAAMGINRGSDVTFTQPLTDLATGALQLARREPVVGWQLPVWQTPVNGLKWTFSRDLAVNIVDSLAREGRQSVAKARQGGLEALLPGADVTDLDLPLTKEQMAKGRARATSAGAIAIMTRALWQTGLFSDGGSFNPENRRRENNTLPPYSFSFGVTSILGASKLTKAVFPGKSIDLIDLMGLQADVMRAADEGLLSKPQFARFMDSITQAYARTIDNKNSLRGVIELLNFMTGRAQGKEALWSKQMQNQMNGVIPYSGLLASAGRGFQDENRLAASGRRSYTAQEIAVMKEDPNNNLFEDFAQIVAKNIPLLGMPGAKFRHRDWMGRERKKPFGLPWDVVAPFAPILIEDSPLDQWLVKHGFGGVPVPSAELGTSLLGKDQYGRGLGATMDLEEEDDFREGMWSTVGSVPAEVVLGDKNTFIDLGLAQFNINNYVQGNTMQQALTKLSEDPAYNAMLRTSKSPSLTMKTDKPYTELSISQRQGQKTDKENDPFAIYDVYNAVIDYYKHAGTEVMIRKHPIFMQKAMANAAAQQESVRKEIEKGPLGLSRQ